MYKVYVKIKDKESVWRKMIELYGMSYKLIENKKNGFQEDKLKERYSEILKKYDFIVGDWGYDQLRLKGFYNDHNSKASYDTKISTLEDYLYEYCNFGCAYFVLEKVNHPNREG